MLIRLFQQTPIYSAQPLLDGLERFAPPRISLYDVGLRPVPRPSKVWNAAMGCLRRCGERRIHQGKPALMHSSRPRFTRRVEREVRLTKDLESFEKFCEKGALPNLAPETVAELQSELSAKFGEGNVTLTPDQNEQNVAVEIGVTRPDGNQAGSKSRRRGRMRVKEIRSRICCRFRFRCRKIQNWFGVLARREDLAPEEAARALASIEKEFWATKNGQKLLRGRARTQFCGKVLSPMVPASALLESGFETAL